jgi:precorrin-8X/cobalt-precorrin-8 methylmutase
VEVILLAGHGSPKDDANNIEQVAGLLHNVIHPGCCKDCVRVAYLQFARPDIREALEKCIAEGASRIIVHPYFLSSGMHVTKDIPEIIEGVKAMAPDVEFIYTEPLGINSKLVQVVLERIEEATGISPQGIEEKSFELLSKEVDLSDVPPERLPIVQRVIHSTADFEFKNSLRFHPEAINTGVAAIRAGRDILTDVEMVRAGINKRLLSKWGGRVLCGITKETGHEMEEAKMTRAEKGIAQALAENDNIGIIAIGNAPTALLKTIEILNSSHATARSLLVVGVPVGFVRAIESKALLARQDFPFITNLSRKGGTPVAVAIVNALLKMAEGNKK